MSLSAAARRLWLCGAAGFFLLAQTPSRNNGAVACTATNISLRTQAEIDSFQSTYGQGSATCDSIQT